MLSIAGSVDVDANTGHRQPVQDRGGQGRIAKVLAPGAELDVGRESSRAALMAAVDEVTGYLELE